MTDPENAVPAEGEAGEKLSKSEMKRRAKMAAVKAKKEAKAAENAAKNATAKSEKKVEEEEEDPSLYYQKRCSTVSAKSLAAYPHKFQVDMRIGEFLEKFDYLAAGEHAEDVSVGLAGRIYSKRASGAKLLFYDLHQCDKRVQVMCDARNVDGDFTALHAEIKRGDIVGINGFPGRSKRGELSIWPRGDKSMTVLTPCLHLLPHTHTSIADQELRYRRRYLDLLMNPNVRTIFQKRAKVISLMRRFLDDREFLEVETPMIALSASGAAAKPFETLHNDLKMKMFMRISPELYLKRLVVGGYDRVYEIGRNFRNESIDLTHNPEFTMCEFYMAYADYNDLMELTKEMVSGIVKDVHGSYEVDYHYDANDPEKVHHINFDPKNWKVLRMLPALEEAIGDGFALPSNLDTEEAREYLDTACVKYEVDCSPPRTTARLLDKLVGQYVEPKCISPTFLIDHPRIMSPLAKWHRSDPERLTERFELFVNGRELCNAYTELNSPFIQRERFQQQAELAAKMKDDEAMSYDEDFCLALEYGLPPTAGWGLGIDRLCMLLSDTYNIKEVLLFPTMKPYVKEENEATTER